MQQLLAIATGGALGSLLRFGMSLGIGRLLGHDFPYGTLIVNIAGSLLAGIFFVLIVERGLFPEWRGLIMIGFLGAMTTFSTFSIETLMLLESGELNRALLNVMLNVTFCLIAAWFGLIMGRQL